MENVSGCYIVYKTTNLINNKIYVGQHYQKTSAFDGYLGSGKLLLKSINKNSKNNFIRETLEYCTSANVNEREIYWIAELSAMNKDVGYNLTEGGEHGVKGYKHSNEAKMKISQNNSGKLRSEEFKLVISKLHKGKIVTEETKRKMGISQHNRKHSKESIKKTSLKNTGKKRSIETKLKLSLANIKYIYKLSNDENYFSYYSHKERNRIVRRMCYYKVNKIDYCGVIIERVLK